MNLMGVRGAVGGFDTEGTVGWCRLSVSGSGGNEGGPLWGGVRTKTGQESRGLEWIQVSVWGRLLSRTWGPFTSLLVSRARMVSVGASDSVSGDL